MAHVLFDLAASKPLLDFTGYTAARNVEFPDVSGRSILSNALTVSVGDVAAGGSIGTAAATVDVSQIALVNQTTAFKVLTIPTPTSGLAMFYTLANVGTAGFYAYGRYIRPGASHEFLYVPSVGWRCTVSSAQVIEQNWVGATAPANDTNENTLFTATIPGGVMGANGVIVVRSKWDYTNSANSKTIRVRLGGSQLGGFVATTSASFGLYIDICNRNSESAQVGANSSGFGGTTGNTWTSTIDTSADTTLTLTAQKATGTETITMLGVSVLLQRFD